MKIPNPKFYRILFRPVVVITTISPRGIMNAAPISFNTPLSFDPPIYGFACNPEHDTWKNIMATKEFVVNVIGENIADKLHILEKKFPYEVDEIQEAGLTEVESEIVKPKRIGESIGWFECKYKNHFELGDHNFIVSDVVHAEIKDEFVKDEKEFIPDVEKSRPIGHFGREFFVSEMKIKKFRRA